MARRPRSLLWQLGTGIIALQAAVLLVLGWYAFTRIEHFHFERRTDELELIAATLGRRYAERPGWDDPAALQREVAEDGRTSGARITIIDEGGRVLADSHHDPASMENHAGRPEVQAARRTGRGTARRFSRTIGTEMLYLARREGGEHGPIVRTALPLTALQAQLMSLLRTLAVAALVSLLLTSIGIGLLSQRVTTAVARLSRGAIRFARGDLAHRLARPDSRELATLAEALNDMAGQLAEQIERLKVQRGEQQAILQSMSNGVIALDVEQRILSMNKAAEGILHVRGADVRGRLLQEVIREPALSRFATESLDGLRPEPAELTVGSAPPRHLQAHAETLTDPDGRTAGLLIIIDDVTRLRRLEAIRSDFAANVSHELRTPVTNINGYVETLMDGGPLDPEQQRHFLRVIRQNCDRLAAIIEDILALARLEQPAVQQQLDKRPHRVADLVKSVVGQLREAAGAKAMAVEVQVPADLEVSVAGQLAEQAVANLLSNAINYSPRSTSVRISAAPAEDGLVEVAVADEGPGIPADARKRLFERFYRVDSARSRALGGTGLGLALVKHIALVHGGRVEVESEVGRGSTFRILFPRA